MTESVEVIDRRCVGHGVILGGRVGIGAGVRGILRHNGDQGTKADKSEYETARIGFICAIRGYLGVSLGVGLDDPKFLDVTRRWYIDSGSAGT